MADRKENFKVFCDQMNTHETYKNESSTTGEGATIGPLSILTPSSSWYIIGSSVKSTHKGAETLDGAPLTSSIYIESFITRSGSFSVLFSNPDISKPWR